LYRCHTFGRAADLCGKADSEAKRNSYADANSSADSNTNTNASANCNPETFGHADANADGSTDSNTNPGCHSKSMSSSGGLWYQQQQRKFTGKPKKFEGDLPPSYAGSKLELHYSLSAAECLQRAPSARRYADCQLHVHEARQRGTLRSSLN
jgi:hypothetical protein